MQKYTSLRLYERGPFVFPPDYAVNDKIIYFHGSEEKKQENMERKSKLKKKLKFLYFRPHKRLFGSAERELNGGERSVS